MNRHEITRISRKFQRAYKSPKNITPNIISRCKKLKENKQLIVFSKKEKKGDLFKTEIYLQYRLIKLSIKQAKKDLIIIKRNSHNKSIDELNCKQRRNLNRQKLIKKIKEIYESNSYMA